MTPPNEDEIEGKEAREVNDHAIGCDCLECTLDGWRMPGSSKRFREAAQEIDMLRALIDRQLRAMSNTPMSDMNYAGIEWCRAARKQRGPHD